MTDEQIKKIKESHKDFGSAECMKVCVEIYKAETGKELSAISQTKLSDIIDKQVGQERTTDDQIIETLEGLISIAANS